MGGGAMLGPPCKDRLLISTSKETEAGLDADTLWVSPFGFPVHFDTKYSDYRRVRFWSYVTFEPLGVGPITWLPTCDFVYQLQDTDDEFLRIVQDTECSLWCPSLNGWQQLRICSSSISVLRGKTWGRTGLPLGTSHGGHPLRQMVP